MPSDEIYLRQLRDALKHLYDPDLLRRNPLAQAFGVANRLDTPSALQRILIEAIEALNPRRGAAARSLSAAGYEALYYHFVEKLSPQEVADQMGICVRHFRRKQSAALDTLAEHLKTQFDLPAPAAHLPPTLAANPIEIEQELTWLKNSTQRGFSDPQAILPPVIDLAQKLSRQHHVHLGLSLEASLPALAVEAVAVRQMLLGLFSVALPRAADGQVQFTAHISGYDVEFHIHSEDYPSGPKPILDGETASLNLAQKVADLCGGRLTLTVDTRAFDAVLQLPALEQLPVLVIDDNADALQLLQRYATGTRYRLTTLQNPQQALETAQQTRPQVIVLDVMMPHADGWEVLERLKTHPDTSHIPIIVYTILAQKEFATLLGAHAFLQKPVSQQAFLAILDRLLA
jgi:CheY-like chemotaxis protein